MTRSALWPKLPGDLTAMLPVRVGSASHTHTPPTPRREGREGHCRKEMGMEGAAENYGNQRKIAFMNFLPPST